MGFLTDFLETLSGYISGAPWLGLVAAFVAGIVTSLTPCALSAFPLLIGGAGYYGGTKKAALRYSLLFCLGMAVVFVAIGLLAALAGQLINLSGGVVSLVLGALMVLMCLQLWGVISLLPDRCGYVDSGKKGSAGALLTGALAALIGSPCATPVLVAISAVAAAKGSLMLGAGMLFLYAAGHSILLIAAGTAVGFAKRISSSPGFSRVSGILNAVLGALILLLGLYLISTGISTL